MTALDVVRAQLAPAAEELAVTMDRVALMEDREARHVVADGLLVAILRSLGFEEAMDVYTSIPKWFA